MRRPSIVIALALVVVATVSADCEVSTPKPKVSTVPTGRALIKDMILANDVTSFTLRSEYIEPENDPDHVLPKKWAQQIGYMPVGIASPAMALWYNQGFFQWTIDGDSLHLYRPRMRVVRSSGADAVVEYKWDTPKAEVSVRFAVIEGFDKLVMLGRWIPKEKLTSVKLTFMAYPSTFAKPHNRCVTTALGTRRTGSFKLDLSKEKWILLEDDTANRPMAGPAGMLLGDVSAFQSVTATEVGGYGEYVNIEMAPGRTSFALAFHEMPEAPGIAENRASFRLAGDAESAALAKLVLADWDQPLTLPPGDPERVGEIRRRRRESAAARLSRDAEKWSATPKPAKGKFPWFSKIPGGPVKVALLCPRSAAWETTRLASRLDLDVRHLYFDSHTAICAANAWPYRSQTGDGPLGVRLATYAAREVCSDPAREVILVSHLSGEVIPQRVRKAILKAVAKGAGLYLSGDQKMLKGWPSELWEHPDKVLVSSVLAAFPWETYPGLRPGERGRIGNAPLRAFRHGAGRVVVWQARMGRYSTFSPMTKASEGLDGGFDRILGMNAAALLVAAGRPLPVQASLTRQIPPARGFRLRWTGPRPATVAFRIQNDLDEVVFEGEFKPTSFPSFPEHFPSGRRYFVETVLKNLGGEAVGFAATSFESSGGPSIENIGFSADQKVHAESVPMIELPLGGVLTTSIRTAGAGGCRLRVEVRDAFDRLLAARSALVQADTTNMDLALSRPLTVCHRLEVSLSREGEEVARERQRFTLPLAYPLDDFTYLMWSYARGEPVTRFVQRRCFELGSDMMDLCHMRGYDDRGAAREYAVAARSGLRLLPYITRVAGTANEDHTLSPGLHSQSWFDQQRDSMKICTRQAVAYAPVAYTLGDENYMRRASGPEIGMSVETMSAYRAWLQIKYGVISDLNTAWGSVYAEFAAITEPVWLPDVAERTDSFASWFDHRLFLDEAFVALHERLAEVVRDVQPGARVGWDGPLSYNWKAGYDFAKWCENLELNQVYSTHWVQGELVRSFAGQG
ncbi:MAG: beta-galactosidase, partial [Lentisphaeria bacterium]|nr:beta-galactosidase [Lentisphaeria bacterium]